MVPYLNKNTLLGLFKQIFLFKKDKPMPLGRWNLVYDKRVIHRVERANEDHCGPCGQKYLVKKNQ